MMNSAPRSIGLRSAGRDSRPRDPADWLHKETVVYRSLDERLIMGLELALSTIPALSI